MIISIIIDIVNDGFPSTVQVFTKVSIRPERFHEATVSPTLV